jgi:uncharacterized membrane protein HdeD (DUF308 family)
VKTQGWLGVRYIVVGLVCVLLSTVVLAYPGLDIVTIILMLSTTLLVFGLARIIDGVFAEYLPYRFRIFSVGVGLFEIVVTITNMLYPQYITQTLIQLLSTALLVHGTTSALIGRFAATLPSLPRGLLMVFGLSSIALSVAAFISIPLGFFTSLYMLSIGYLLNGISEIVLGITGIRQSQNDGLLDACTLTFRSSSSAKM